MSYVGELGYELHLKLEKGNDVLGLFDTLMSIKDLALAGFEALNAMSLEKGHCHWHADIETTDRPNEAGLMFACNSHSNFEGKGQLQQRPLKRLATFLLEPSVALNGNEVIYRNGKIVGYLRRAGFGYTINKSLGTGYVSLEEKEDQESVQQFLHKGSYQLEVMGKMYKADISLKPVFDPQREKMKTAE